MRKILVVRPDLLTAMDSSARDELTTREKMIGILKERVKSATTDRERRIAEDELRVFVGIKEKAAAGSPRRPVSSRQSNGERAPANQQQRQ